MVSFKITNITYDTYDEEAEKHQTQEDLGLPTEMVVQIDLQGDEEEWEIYDLLTYQIENQGYGWLVKSFDFDTESKSAEGLEFTDWANQETKHHGKASLKDWADHEIKKHGGKMSFQDWAKHEDKSHIRRYGAEEIWCDTCGEDGLSGDFHIVTSMPVDFDSGSAGESATLCGDCYSKYGAEEVGCPKCGDEEDYFLNECCDTPNCINCGDECYVRVNNVGRPINEDHVVNCTEHQCCTEFMGGSRLYGAEIFEARYNKDGTIALTDSEWGSCLHLFNGNWLWGGVEMYQIADLKNGAKFKPIRTHSYDALEIIHRYEHLLRKRKVRGYGAEELKKDSCCCGATNSNPCACMIQGVMECNATCPCSLEKKGAEEGQPCPTCSSCSHKFHLRDTTIHDEEVWVDVECEKCRLQAGGYADLEMDYEPATLEYNRTALNIVECPNCHQGFTLNAENWGGDPKGKLALMLQKVRDKAKKPKKPLKIEKLGADSGWNMPPGVFSIPGHPDDDEYEAVWEWFSEGFPEEDFAPKLWELEGKPGDSAEKWWEDISEPITLYHPVFGHYDGHKPKEEFEEVFDRHYDFISDEAKKMWEGWYENDPLWVEDYVFEDDKNAETSGEWKPTYKDMDSNYFFLVGEDEDGRSKIVSYHRTFEEAKTAADASNEPLEIEEYRGSRKNISPEEQEKQDKDYQEWRKRELTGELFEDFWWKDEMNRYGNSDSPYLRYSTIPDKDKKAFDDTKFFDEHILPKEYNWREKESHQWIAHRWGISERLAQIIESSRTFGMYMNQRNSPATIKKYRQRILDAFDGYTPTTDKEKKMLEIVRNDMATRGVKGPSPSYWCASGRGILKKPELSYAYDDYYTMPIPFMGYGKIADHEKYGIHPACKGCDQCETYESEGIGQWEIGEQLEEAQMNAETFEGIPKSVSILSPLEDVRCDKYEMEVNFENEDIVIVSGEELKAIIDDGWDLDSVSSFEGAGMSLLFTRNPNRAYAAESFATEGKFFVCDACEETLPLKLRNRSLKVAQEFGMGIGDICRPCVKRIKSYEEEVKKLNPPKTWADYYNAPTKGIDTFTQPFEESSLDSGTVKKVLVGLGIGGLALFGYNKWK